MKKESIPDAGDGEIYVCRACGKTAKSVYDFTDVACVVNAVLCSEKSLQYGEDGTVTHADPIEDAE